MFDHLNEACLAAEAALREDPRLRDLSDDVRQLAAAVAVKGAAAAIEAMLRASFTMVEEYRVSVPSTTGSTDRVTWSTSPAQDTIWRDHAQAAGEGRWGEPHVERRFTGFTSWVRVYKPPGGSR